MSLTNKVAGEGGCGVVYVLSRPSRCADGWR